MRKLETTDVFEAARLILKIGVREEVQDVVARAQESKDKQVKLDLAFDLFVGIISKAASKNAEIEIYKFLANIFECDANDVGKMDPFDLIEKLQEVASFEKWKNFFKLAAKSIRKN